MLVPFLQSLATDWWLLRSNAKRNRKYFNVNNNYCKDDIILEVRYWCGLPGASHAEGMPRSALETFVEALAIGSELVLYERRCFAHLSEVHILQNRTTR